MKRNILKTAYILSVFFVLYSCSDTLDVDSGSSFTDDVIYSNSDLVEGVVMGIYNVIGENNSYRNCLWLKMGVNTDIEYRPGADYLAVKTSTKADDLIAWYEPNADMGDGFNNSDKANPWSRLYQAIERANLCIAGINEYGSPEVGSDMGHLLGEALALRAFFYYDLIKWWGDVPFRTEPVNEDNLYIAKTDRDTIYNQIIADLGEAEQLMYSAGQTMTSTTKRLSKDAVRGLRARIALSAAGYSMRSDGAGGSYITNATITDERRTELYKIARNECDTIISNGEYSLDDDFKDIFYNQCQDDDSQGGEVMFELPYNMGVRGRMLYNLGLPREADGTSASTAKYNSVKIGGQFYVWPSFFYDYDADDTRRDVTVVPYSVVQGTDGVMEQSLGNGAAGFRLAKWRAEWYGAAPLTGTDDGVSPIILRYADVLLMFAEADLELGGSAGEEYFNMVRRRAFGTGSSTHDEELTLENLQKERAFEFCGENLRKYDLERWGILGSKMDEAKEDLAALRDGTGDYATVPSVIYYQTEIIDENDGERGFIIYGLNRGEFDDKTETDPSGGWIEKDWTQASSNGIYKLSDTYINGLYHQDPDKYQLLPIMTTIISDSQGMLTNDYGY